MNPSEQEQEDERMAQLRQVEEETDAAADEARQIGGDAPVESDDPAQQPLLEAGEGESEGFELAEKKLVDIASHGDQHRFPGSVVPPPEEAGIAEFGEADEPIPPDA
jgi:hypothetical protein